MERVSATEARIHLGELMRRAVETDQPISVEHDGKSYVVILSASAYEQLVESKSKPDWKELLEQAQDAIQSGLKGRKLPPPEEVLRQLREERDAQLLDLH